MFGCGWGGWCVPVGAAAYPGWFAPSRLVGGCGFSGCTGWVGVGIVAIAVLILIALGIIF